MSDYWVIPLLVIPISLILLASHLLSKKTAVVNRYRSLVPTVSPRCVALRKLNSEFNFIKVNPHLYYQRHFNNKPQFDRCNIDDIFLSEVKVNRSNMELLLASTEMNERLYRDYCTRLLALPPTVTPQLAEQKGIPYIYFQKYEATTLRVLELKPICTFNVKCTKTYTSQHGRKSYELSKTYTPVDVKRCFLLLEQQAQYKNSAQYQRSLVTPKLRYQILQRDGFRCVLCGCTSDHTMLEVDHIRPISKGGRTVPENLRTLCRNCNRGKSDSYNATGPN